MTLTVFETSEPEPESPTTQSVATDEDVDEMIARINAKVEAILAGHDEPDEFGRTFKDFSRYSGLLPKDWKFDREELYA